MRGIVLRNVLSLCLVSSCAAASAAEWRNRTIYQLLTDRFAPSSGDPVCTNLGNYCGGTFQGIIQHLDYIQSMGFDAVWISPIPVNTPGGYHGYWQSEMYQVNPYFGSAADLLALSQALHDRGSTCTQLFSSCRQSYAWCGRQDVLLVCFCSVAYGGCCRQSYGHSSKWRCQRIFSFQHSPRLP